MIYNIFFLITAGTLLVVVYWAIRAEIADEARWTAQRLRRRASGRGIARRGRAASRSAAPDRR